MVQGGRDFQCIPAEFALWKKALAGRANATFKFYPSVYHMLIPGSGPPNLEEYGKPGHVLPQLVSDIASWMQAH